MVTQANSRLGIVGKLVKVYAVDGYFCVLVAMVSPQYIIFNISNNNNIIHKYT
ncbi:hypothetical protein CONCODRAFT_12203 [Conidiobolus coronatus NRRL 28638]|uniref:Uncharacterized protein n=1 Tax=Conidiobolus coronatus (strain ATCC 28846 / CBS 209.66 / NRRL 28638) TaxID=796925 RepID=A0A137NTL2_CONC2|nr:hypothetical protein CONCODRAFT_12203 [Conidiobolus coronatus NRRL 28638]|eukprot:KXN66038.1 hypothetical protein CONCODRAFT_12203 [Conidiobolus coronatus NRRL 28638]